MTKYREILRLRNLGLSQNDIATSCQVSKKTVNRVLKLAKEHNLNWPLEERLTDNEIDKIIHPNGNEARKITDRKLPDYERVKIIYRVWCKIYLFSSDSLFMSFSCFAKSCFIFVNGLKWMSSSSPKKPYINL